MTVKLNGDPLVAEVLSGAGERRGLAHHDTRVVVAAGLIPLLAVIVSVGASGRGRGTGQQAVPLPLSTKLSPQAALPVSVIAGVG